MYYVVTQKRVKDRNGKYFAETKATNKSNSYFKLSEKKSILERCPKCGFTVFINDNVGMHAVQFDNDNIADFIINDTDIRYWFIVSEKAFEILRSFKGIKSFVQVDVVLVNGKIIDGVDLLLVEVEYSKATLSRINSGLGTPTIRKDRKKCSVCNPDGFSYLTFHGITLDNKEDDFDIFTLYDDPSFLFISDQIVDTFNTLGLTNLVERSVPANDYHNEFRQFEE